MYLFFFLLQLLNLFIFKGSTVLVVILYTMLVYAIQHTDFYFTSFFKLILVDSNLFVWFLLYRVILTNKSAPEAFIENEKNNASKNGEVNADTNKTARYNHCN
uniref:Uncharacterized protein n=1 Tax=Cacopsylla melanoneura TaxID=428564 RepID=A0A8D8WYK7_9HEMI